MFPVKVQVAVAGNEAVLIYNKDRSIKYQTSKSEEVKAIKRMMKGEVKRYMMATLTAGIIDLWPNEPIEEQDW